MEIRGANYNDRAMLTELVTESGIKQGTGGVKVTRALVEAMVYGKDGGRCLVADDRRVLWGYLAWRCNPGYIDFLDFYVRKDAPYGTARDLCNAFIDGNNSAYIVRMVAPIGAYFRKAYRRMGFNPVWEIRETTMDKIREWGNR